MVSLTKLSLAGKMTISKKKFWKFLKEENQEIDPAAHLESFVEGLHSEEDYWIKGYKRWQKINQSQKNPTSK